ncbi:ABC transporter ATP-binding protein [candidate division CSSED10-310 bacterium]|uniref:ABC transporter ATP-binding protein n=1 Tax=candidate division CSSED10-310 bacterium TaxID=2855610 RepID=A0ABV6Z1V6_UNCC1
MYVWETFRSLWPYIKLFKLPMFLGIVAVLLTDVCVLTAPKLQAYAIRSIEHRAPLKIVFLYSFGVFFIIALAGVFRYIWRILFINAAMKIAYELRKDLFRKLMSFSPKFYGEFTTGDLMARATNDLKAVRMAIVPGLIIGLDIIIIGSASAVIIFLMDWQLALLALIPTPFIALAVGYFDTLISTVFERVQKQFSLLSEKVRENVSGIRVVKSYAQEKAEIENFSALSQEYVTHNMKLWNIEGIFRPIIIFFSTISIILIMIFGLERVIQGTMDLGDFWAFIEYTWLIVWPMIGIGWLIGLILRGAASMKRLNEIFERVPIIKSPSAPIRLNQVRGDIFFSDVSFRFEEDGEWVLNDIDLSINAGEKLAIVGKIGSGKSALINLLLRFHDPQRGRIMLDGVDISQIDVRDLRQAFGIVPQETFLFSDTIKENIVFGVQEYDDQKVYDVANIAQLYQNIQEFPLKFETLVGEKGVTLSGGQKQRMAISRALITDPQIIVFDDAFSSLDTDTEDRILSNLQRNWQDKTIIVISHRISTIRNFNHIIVLDQGRIVEEGKHDTLLTRKGIYWRIYERQKLSEALH